MGHGDIDVIQGEVNLHHYLELIKLRKKSMMIQTKMTDFLINLKNR